MSIKNKNAKTPEVKVKKANLLSSVPYKKSEIKNKITASQ